MCTEKVIHMCLSVFMHVCCGLQYSCVVLCLCLIYCVLLRRGVFVFEMLCSCVMVCFVLIAPSCVCAPALNPSAVFDSRHVWVANDNVETETSRFDKGHGVLQAIADPAGH